MDKNIVGYGNEITSYYLFNCDIDYTCLGDVEENDDFKETRAFNIILMDDAVEEERVLAAIDRLKRFAKENDKAVQVSISNTVSIFIIDRLLQLKEKGEIEKIFITVDCIYENLETCRKYLNQLTIGVENWKNNSNFGENEGVWPLSESDTLDVIEKHGEKINRIIEDVLSNKPNTDLEKIVLVDAWFQKNIQYVQGEKSNGPGGIIYYAPDNTERAKLSTVFEKKYGECRDIATAVAIVLNDPRLGIKCRVIEYIDHCWNVVKYDGKEYYLDVTHNITRNPNKVKGALKAMCYSDSKTLIGRYEKDCYCVDRTYFNTSLLQDKGFDREIINEVVSHLKARGAIEQNWGEELNVKTWIKE